MGNPTNPNRVVRVKDLDRFKTKSDASYATAGHYHSEKADKVTGGGTNNHIAALNSNGNLKDSGRTVMTPEEAVTMFNTVFNTSYTLPTEEEGGGEEEQNPEINE